MRRNADRMGLTELMALVAGLAVALAVLRANIIAGLSLLAFLPLIAVRARAALRIEEAAGRPATPGRVVWAWTASWALVVGVLLLASSLAVGVGYLVVAGAARVVLWIDPARFRRAGLQDLPGMVLFMLLLMVVGGALAAWVANRLLRATWPGRPPPHGPPGHGRMGGVDQHGGPRVGRAGPALGDRPLVEGDPAL